MEWLEKGDRVRVDIPNADDPDFDLFHGRDGIITRILSDKVGEITGDNRDNNLYRVKFEDETSHDFRWRDLRPI